MKKLFLFVLAATALLGASAQNTAVNPYPRTITVNGSAEREVVPDEIYVNVELKEYDKKGSGKVSLESIRRDFLNAAKAIGLPDSAVTIASYDGNNWNYLWRKKRKEELYAGITYQVKFSQSRQLDELVNRLDDNATQNFYITRVDHSRIQEFRKQLKIAAVKAAKDKAQYLAEPIGERVGEAVTINEPAEFNYPVYPMMRNAAVANTAMKAEAAGDDAGGGTDFRKIKLKYDVTVVFALK